MKKFLLGIALAVVLSTGAFAGWEHLGDRTYWVDSPTAASCFIRDNASQEVCPAVAPIVFPDATKTASTNAAGISISFGYWSVDANGDFYPLANLGVADYVNMRLPGWRVDVEWTMDENGDIYLK